MTEGMMDISRKLCNKVDTVHGFCYLGDRISICGGWEAAVTKRVRIG